MLMKWEIKNAAFLLGALIVAATFALGAENPAKMEIKTPSFQTGAEIPRKFTCDGEDVSPAIAWEGAPAGAKAFALIVDDPDAPSGTWVHWVIYDLPGETRALAEAEPAMESLPGGAMQGLNDFRKVGYGGPCPPRGPAHRYFFKLYALDAPTNLKPRATKQQLLDAIKGHIVGAAELMGRYQRP
jgi:Raf kinase inhibitor-like YbhB/YbcL family protein